MRLFLVFLALALVACSDDTTPLDASPDLGIDSAMVDGLGGDGQTNDGPSNDASDADLVKPDLPLPDAPLSDGPLSDASLLSTCQQLNTDYIAAIKPAKVCHPLQPVVQCTKKVNNKLACPCLTHVNQNNVQEVQTLAALEAKFAKLGCAALFMCPAIPCPSPGTGVCTPGSSGGTGQCEDVQP